MDPATAAFILLGVMFVALAFGVWIGISLAAVGYVAMALLSTRPIGLNFGSTLWSANTSWALTALPMFIWMGEILFRSRLAEDMFKGLAPWMQRLPGRLLHTNVFGCGIFAAISGSSAATAATIGKMTIPELRKRGYDDFMLVGSLAGSGTLGLLIPPSIIMIVYGVAAEVSIARLFIAGVIPGIMLMLIFSLIVIGYAVLYPHQIPPRDPVMTLKEKLWESRRLIPTVLLILTVLGSIYGGIATPTESAVLGVVGALILSGIDKLMERTHIMVVGAAVAGSLVLGLGGFAYWDQIGAIFLIGLLVYTTAIGGISWSMFKESALGATRTNCMIALILSGAAFLSIAMGFTGLPRLFADWIVGLELSKAGFIAALTLVFIVMGCFIDGISMVVLTTAVILPAVKAAGIDLLWFGIFIVLVVEMAQITPPVGFNLYVLQSLAKKNMGYVALAALPFFAGMMIMIAIVFVFPDIVTWLPNQMLGQK
ncbi:MAG: TRAP transporter large permease [Bosea sp. (in: a-proteobacteria)]|jgi:C4-dicarboxylate transporter DctM subunit